MQKSLSLPKKLISSKSMLCALSIAFSVALPQLFHLAGASALASAFLPMHFSILVFAFTFGSTVGVISGTLSVVLSFLLTSMPSAAILPFMMLELATYGLVAGLIKDKKLPFMLKLLVVMFAGRLVRVAGTYFAVTLLGFDTALVTMASLVSTSIYGIVLQIVLVPVLVKFANKVKNTYER